MSENESPSKKQQSEQDGSENKETQPNLGNFFNRSWFWIILALLTVFLFRQFLDTTSGNENNVGLDKVAEYINNGQVEQITVSGEVVKIDLTTSDEAKQSRKEGGKSLWATLVALGASEEKFSSEEWTRDVKRAPNSGAIFSWLIMLLPMLLIFAFFIFIMRQAGAGGQNRAMQFGRSKTRKLDTGDRPTITFEDVAGSDEAKQELEEVVEFLREPEKFAALGARIPTGVLMVGSPGTGKTLLAKAVAGEAGVPFFSSSGSEFVEMFVGVGASRVRDLFEQAKKNAPCIIFIEPDILDPALLRPGRFDRKVIVDRPDRKGREAILRVHSRGKPLEPDVDLDVIAAQTPGMVGADLENLINEAAILAARRDRRSISMDEITESIERVMAGPARRGRVIDERDRRTIAYHEAGHAIVMESLKNTDGVGKITIVSRGQALGYVMPLPEEDKTMKSQAEYEDEIAGLLAGRVAEEIIFKEATTGATNDIERVTKLAKAMVTRFGMSKKIGLLQLEQGDSNPFMGMDFGEQRTYSEDVARTIDSEVRRIIESAYEKSETILLQKIDKLRQVADALLEQEVLDRQEFLEIFDGTASQPQGAIT